MPGERMSRFNKRILNHVTRWFAFLPFGPFALMRHTGRRSGMRYETPIMVEQVGDQFLIALTYGPTVDWYRNLLASGHGTLVWHGRVYTIGRPTPVPTQAGLQAHPLFERSILRLLGTQDFVQVPAALTTSTEGQKG